MLQFLDDRIPFMLAAQIEGGLFPQRWMLGGLVLAFGPEIFRSSLRLGSLRPLVDQWLLDLVDGLVLCSTAGTFVKSVVQSAFIVNFVVRSV